MKHLLVILLISIVFPVPVFTQQKPDWVDKNGISTHYHEGLYVTGFGIGENESLADRRSIAEQNARSDLSSKFIVKIQSELQSILRESSDTGFYTDIRNSVSTQTQLKMFSVDIDHYDDRRHERSYALALMEIESAISNYSSHLEELSEKISNFIQVAETAEQRGDIKQAIINYRKTFPLYIELGEMRTILCLLQGKSPFGSQDEFQTALSVTSTDIESRINNIIHENITSIHSGTVSLVEQLNTQVDEKLSIVVFPLTYLDTDFSSEFSSYFLSALEAELTPYFNVVSHDISGDHNVQTQNVLTGTYWVKEEMVQILVYVTELNTGSKSAAATVTIPKIVIENEGIEILPRNFQQAMEDTRVFLKQDVISGLLSLKVWTSKGNKNLIFKENEKTEIFVRVNKPCFLQIIYHMANGVRLLLDNNHYIDISKVNRVYTYPAKFYFTPPLGVERLQIFACTEEFDDIYIIPAEYNGIKYKNVFAEDFKNHTITMRGIMRVNPKREIAERIITITTIQ